jgi:hypothetical protein
VLIVKIRKLWLLKFCNIGAGESQKVVWAKFSTLSEALLLRSKINAWRECAHLLQNYVNYDRKSLAPLGSDRYRVPNKSLYQICYWPYLNKGRCIWT